MLYASNDDTEIETDYDWGTTFANYPAKFDRMVILKDPKSNDYAYFAYTYADGSLGIEEYGFTYPKGYNVNVLFFTKESVSEEITYTPIPIRHRGLAFYSENVDNELLHFQETATRTVASRTDPHMNRFILPKQYFQTTNISFLEFQPMNNIYTSGGDGLYVIRQKP